MARHWITAHLRDVPHRGGRVRRLPHLRAGDQRRPPRRHPLSVTLHLLEDRIRVDVADGSTVVPWVKDYGTDAATGRGLTLFATLASNWGVQAVRAARSSGSNCRSTSRSPHPANCRTGASASTWWGTAQRPTSTTCTRASLAPTVHAPARHPGGPPAESQRGVRGLFRELRLMKEHAEAGGRTPPRSCPTAWLGLVSRSAPLPRSRPGAGRDVAGGGRPPPRPPTTGT
jgi:hypothetical protein